MLTSLVQTDPSICPRNHIQSRKKKRSRASEWLFHATACAARGHSGNSGAPSWRTIAMRILMAVTCMGMGGAERLVADLADAIPAEVRIAYLRSPAQVLPRRADASLE